MQCSGNALAYTPYISPVATSNVGIQKIKPHEITGKHGMYELRD